MSRAQGRTRTGLSQTKDAKDHEPSGVKALKHATCFKIIGEQF